MILNRTQDLANIIQPHSHHAVRANLEATLGVTDFVADNQSNQKVEPMHEKCAQPSSLCFALLLHVRHGENHLGGLATKLSTAARTLLTPVRHYCIAIGRAALMVGLSSFKNNQLPLDAHVSPEPELLDAHSGAGLSSLLPCLLNAGV